jgi:hypothetical protein
MKAQLCVGRRQPANFPGLKLKFFCALVSATFVSGVLAWDQSRPRPVSNGPLKSGDIVCTDSGDAIAGGAVIKIDPNTGQMSIIAQGGYLVEPFGIAITSTRQILVADVGRCLVQIDPINGKQTLLADRSSLGYVIGLALDPRHEEEVLVANYSEVVRLNLRTKERRIVFDGAGVSHPVCVAVANDGGVYSLNVAWPKGRLSWELIRINLHSGRYSLVTADGYFENPQGIAALGQAVYVTDVATEDRNFGSGRVLRVDAGTGAQTVVSQSGLLVCPVGIASDAAGLLFVADPYVINPESPDLYDGGIVSIHPATGVQRLVARGHGSCVNPCGIAVVP